MNHRSDLGREGEAFAAKYLEKMGYWIIDRNKRWRWGELDIIAVAPDKTLVFVEVKTTTPGAIKPEDEMTAAKIKKFRRTATIYAGTRPELVNDERGWRLDVIALEKNGNESFSVRHYENI